MCKTIQIFVLAIFVSADLSTALSSFALAQADTSKKRNLLPAGKLAVDTVFLKNGNRYDGLVISNNPETQVQLLMERDWIRNQVEKDYAKLLDNEKALQQKAYDQIKTRVEDWIAERVNDRVLVVFLQDELERITNELGNVESKRFLLIDVPAKKVRKVKQATKKKRQIALAALDNQLKDASYRSAFELEAELRNKQIYIEYVRVNFAAEVSPKPQDERQWNARKAIIEFSYREGLEFQGQGSMLVRVGEQPDLNSVLREMLIQQSLNAVKDLGGLDGNQTSQNVNWYQKAIDAAEAEGFLGVRATRVLSQPGAPTVTVESFFLAKFAAGDWRPVARYQQSGKVTDQDSDRIGELANDPQVQRLLKSFGGSNGGLVQQAMQTGAATQKAL